MDQTLLQILRSLVDYSQTIDQLRSRVAELEAELQKKANAEKTNAEKARP